MSFRSIGALPTCLHGRLAARRAVNFNTSATNQRAPYSLAQSIGNVVNSDIVHQRPPESAPARRHDLDQRSRRRRAGASKSNDEEIPHPALSTDSLRPSKINLKSPTLSETSRRIGAVLEVPDFIKGFSASPASSAAQSHDELRPSSLKSLQEEQSTGVYEEWEQLHDEFRNAWKTSPDELSNMFLEQRRLAKQFLGDITYSESSIQEFKRKWLDLDTGSRRKLLPSLLIGSLAESASQTLFVLSNIGAIPYSFRIRMNCLRYLAHLYRKDLRQDSKLKTLYEKMVEILRSPDVWPTTIFPAVLLQNLLFWSTPEQCQKIIKDFFEKYPDSEESSVLAIIDHYLRIEDREQAFEHFKRLPADALSQPSERIKNLRDRLLKLDFVERNEDGANFKYLPKLLALGIQPDEDLHNIVLENALSNEMPDVAWDLHQYMGDSKFRSNARSHLVLLRDSFLRGDFKRVNEVMTSIHNREDLIRDQYLMAYSMNIIRNISCYEKKLNPNEARSHIMALYDRAYNREPLVRLGIVSSLDDKSSLPEPSPTMLAFTIWTCILTRRKEYDVRTLWEWFKYLIANGDEVVSQSAKHDVIYNGFILFYIRRTTSLFRALDVIQYMLSNQLCLPTSRTWSILLCGFLKHEQTDQAQKVLALMRSKGYKVHEVQEATDRYGRCVPQGHDLKAMAARIDQNLDESVMPEGIDELLAESLSLQGKSNSSAIAGFSGQPS